MRVAAAMVGVVALLGWPEVARACSCALVELQPVVPWPEDPIPENTRIWLPDFSPFTTRPDVCDHKSPVLEGPNGLVPIEVQLIQTDVFSPVVLTPKQLLTIGETYTVRACDRVSEKMATVVEFEVTEPADVESPPVPEIDLGKGWITDGNGSSCGGGATADLDVHGTDAIVVLDINGSATGDPDLIVTSATAIYAHEDQEWFDTVGHGACGLGTYEPVEREEVQVRVGTYDLAGNFSGWSETQSTTFSNCACSSSNHARGGWMLGLLLAGVLRRRE